MTQSSNSKKGFKITMITICLRFYRKEIDIISRRFRNLRKGYSRHEKYSI